MRPESGHADPCNVNVLLHLCVCRYRHPRATRMTCLTRLAATPLLSQTTLDTLRLRVDFNTAWTEKPTAR
jgi:hypothetical protein